MFDLRKSNLLTKKIKLIEPDFIFHLAAQSLVKKSYDDPVTMAIKFNINIKLIRVA